MAPVAHSPQSAAQGPQSVQYAAKMDNPALGHSCYSIFWTFEMFPFVFKPLLVSRKQ